MRQPGSVLIVVLGLLAILAVVGITFVTMSSIDRSTASNFALQTQFELAKDGAVEFAVHHLAQDLWELKNRTYTTMLMSGINNNDPWDAPGADDPWLANTVEPAAAGSPPKYLSFGGRTGLLYGISFGGMAPPSDAPDNLGTGVTGARNGIWLLELAFPYEGGLVRVSLTIQDHASLINLNAHGNNVSPNSWPLSDMIGWGYFISDVDPGFGSKVDMTRLLIGDTSRPGRWGPIKKAPGNPNAGEILFENPAAAVPWQWDGKYPSNVIEGDYPLDLDEEFDLRRIPKTGDPKFPTRVAGGSNPIIAGLVANANPTLRLAYTTVGWTSECRGDWNSAGHMNASGEGAWSARKADLNYDDPKAIYNAMALGRTCPLNGDHTWGGQFAANVAGFRDGTSGCGIKGYDLGSGPTCAAASRQPILSKVSAQMDGGALDGRQPWKIMIQIISPWNSDTYQNEALGLTTQGIRCEVNGTTAGSNSDHMHDPAHEAPKVIEATGIMGDEGKPLTDALKTLTIVYSPANYAGDVTLDQLESEDIALLAANPQGGIYRPICVETEKRGTNAPPNTETTVLYVGPWQKGLNGDINSFAQSSKDLTSGIPIRFPRSVDGSSSNLPPQAPAAGKPFKAIARLGDIDQILCQPSGKGPADFWPWVIRVAKSAGKDTEIDLKFNWDDTTPPGGSNVSRLNASNVLAVGGPWKDNIDNDGDNKKDTDDAGTGNSATDLGRFAGPELRVAGKVNLNTATDSTFWAMESGLRLQSGCLRSLAAANPRRIFRSIAEVRSTLPKMDYDQTSNPNARGWIEQRDEAFNRISNIASIRSDTYSVYGTVQYGTIEKSGATKTFKELRKRRFWALVDRSPTLAYSPTDSNFIPPRVMILQWMN